MLRHQIKLAFRNLYRNKFFTVIKLFGLTIGISVATLILLWVNDELQFDAFHRNYSTIYRIVGKDVGVASPRPLAPIISEEISDVLQASRMRQDVSTIEHKGALYDIEVSMIDNSFFEIFSFPFVEGNPTEALENPKTIVISQSLAQKLFDKDNELLGRSITFLFNGARVDYDISGVVRDIPDNSHIQTQCFISFSDFHKGSIDNWSDWGATTYIRTADNPDINKLIANIHRSINSQTDYSVQQIQPLEEIHLHSSFQSDHTKTGSLKHVYFFSIIGLILLIIASINFINLNISQVVNRSKEVGIKIVFGASRVNLIKQFTIESLLLVLIAGFMALILVEVLMPIFNSFVAKRLELDINSSLVVIMITIIVIMSLVAGLFSLPNLSSLRSLSLIKSNISATERKISVKKILLMGQIASSVTIMIVGLVIMKQIHLVQNMDMGFDKDYLVTFNIINSDAEKISTIKNELLKNAEILNCTSGNVLSPHNNQSTSSLSWDGKTSDKEFYANIHRVDCNFLETYEVTMKEGRFFSEYHQNDKLSSFILNEAAVNYFNLESPVGKTFSLWGIRGNIIGVVKDYYFKSAHQQISPSILWMNDHKNFGGYESITLRIKPDEIAGTITFAQSIIKQFNSGYLPEYHFVDS